MAGRPRCVARVFFLEFHDRHCSLHAYRIAPIPAESREIIEKISRLRSMLAKDVGRSAWPGDSGGSDDGERTERGRAEAGGREAEEAPRRGLLSQDKGRKGFAVGARASGDLRAAFTAEKFTAGKAATIADGARRCREIGRAHV